MLGSFLRKWLELVVVLIEEFADLKIVVFLKGLRVALKYAIEPPPKYFKPKV